jgi:hypothetical protein
MVREIALICEKLGQLGELEGWLLLQLMHFVRLPTVCEYLFVAAEVGGVTYLLASLASEGIGSLCFRVED